jgi:hypothetical protein
MTKPKDPWDYTFMGCCTTAKGAKILRVIAEEVESAGVRKLNIHLRILEQRPKPRTKKPKPQEGRK